MRKKLLKAARKALPPLSRTEKEALESGTVGWEGELLRGTPNWDKLFELKKPELTADEQSFLDNETEELCKMLDNWNIQQEGDMPKEAWDFIKQKGFMGLEIPKNFGGKGFTSQAHSAVIMKIASRSIAAACTVMVPNSLGPAELLKKYGTEEQKKYYLPRLADGREVPCFALTGPNAGSDAGAIPDTGVVCRNEKGELGLRMNWDKRYITLGPVATLLGLAFKMEDPDGLLGKEKDLGITVALIPSDAEGITIGDRHQPMDLAFMNGPNQGKDVFIPLDNIIGGPERAGQGWKMLMECLAVGRSLSLPALSTAAAKLSSHLTGSYAAVRKQFNMSISKFEGIEEPLARMAGTTYMMDAARSATVQMVDQGERPAIPSAIVKYHLTEGMRRVVNDAMDIQGGKAVSTGPNNLMSDIYKGIPIAITVEGANIMTRNLIIFGQGLVRSHPYVLNEMEALEETNDNVAFSKFSRLLTRHIGNTTRSTFKSVMYGLTGRGGKIPTKDKETKKYYKQINRLSASFNLVSDAALGTLGGDLKRRERLSARLGDVYSNMYLASCVLWHYEKNGRPKEDLPLVHWAVTDSLFKAESAMDQALKNHPQSMMGKLLRPFIFPFGRKNKATTDKMDKLAADTIRKPGPMRDKISAGLFLPEAEHEPLAILNKAFIYHTEAEPLEKKLAIAVRDGKLEKGLTRDALLAKALEKDILTVANVDLIRKSDALRDAVVKVDSFPQKALEEAPKAVPASKPKKPEA